MPDLPELSQHPEVARLLELGEPKASRDSEWPDYQALGIRHADIPALIKVAVDPVLLKITDESDPRGWAPVHAWRSLGQLNAQEAIEPLLRLFHEVKDNDWVIEEMPDVFALIGPPAFNPLHKYMTDASRPIYSRLVAATALMELALAHPEMRGASVEALAGQLKDYERNSSGTNGVLVANLVALDAAEHADLILQLFTNGQVDRFIAGDWRDVQARLLGSQENGQSSGAAKERQQPAEGSYREPRTRPRNAPDAPARPARP